MFEFDLITKTSEKKVEKEILPQKVNEKWNDFSKDVSDKKGIKNQVSIFDIFI